MTSTEERVSSRYCLRGHDTWVVGRFKRHCVTCRKEVLNRAQKRYDRTAGGMLARVRNEARRRGTS